MADRTRWSRKDLHTHVEGVVLRTGHRGHSLREQADTGRQWADELRGEEVAIDSLHDVRSNHHVEEASDDDSHHDEGYSLDREVDHGRNSHQKVDSRLDGMVVESESGSDHCAGLRLESR